MHRYVRSSSQRLISPNLNLSPSPLTADTRTNDPLQLGHALLQHQQTGVLPSQTEAPLSALPLGDPLATTSMPEAWVRGAILIRMNSLIRGHSGVRWELIEKMSALLRENITPLVPLRGSISASGGEYTHYFAAAMRRFPSPANYPIIGGACCAHTSHYL